MALNLFILNKQVSVLFFSIAIFFRPEFIVLWVLIIGYVIIKKSFSLKGVILFSAIGIVPFLSFDLFFYDTIVPFPVIAKPIIYEFSVSQVMDNLVCGIIFCPGISDLLGSAGRFLMKFLVYGMVLILIILALYSLLKNVVRKKIFDWFYFVRNISEFHIFLCWFLGITISYALNKVFVFRWYYPLYSLPFVFSMLLGYRFLKTKILLTVYSILIISILIPILSILPEAGIAATKNPTIYRYYLSQARVRQYLQTGKILYAYYPEAVLMTSEIGGLGIGFEGYIVDGVGLVSPDALKYHPMKIPEQRRSGSTGAIPTQFILEKNPEIIVRMDIFIEEFLNSEVIDRYYIYHCPLFTEEDQTHTDVRRLWGSSFLLILIREDFIVDSDIKYPNYCELSLE